jgi:hypothetical protein
MARARLPGILEDGKMGLKKLAFASLMGALGAAASAQSFVINEFVANHVGTDTNEYYEIFGVPSTSLADFRVLHIEGDGTGAGLIDSVFSPGSTDAAGFFVSPYMTNLIENGTITLMLVAGFSGTVGMDLDTNNDGVLDVTPWTAHLDSVGVHDGAATGDFTYGQTQLNPNFDGGTLPVGGASRIPNGMDTNSVSDWMRNDFDGAGIPSFPGTPVLGEAFNTPGTTNTPVPEPATMLALAAGAAALISRRRKA